MFGKVIIREEHGEDAEAMLSRYVELRAKFPLEPPENVGVEVFRTLGKGEDAPMRGEAAARAWEFDLGIQDRIRLFRIGVGSAAPLPTREDFVAETIALARNERIDPKDRLVAYKLASELSGFITKQVDKTISKTPPVPSKIVFRQADFDQDPEGEDDEDEDEAPGAAAAA